MRALAVLLVCLSALVALGQVDAALAPATIKGVGSRWAFQTILEWGFAYELIRPHVRSSSRNAFTYLWTRLPSTGTVRRPLRPSPR